MKVGAGMLVGLTSDYSDCISETTESMEGKADVSIILVMSTPELRVIMIRKKSPVTTSYFLTLVTLFIPLFDVTALVEWPMNARWYPLTKVHTNQSPVFNSDMYPP